MHRSFDSTTFWAVMLLSLICGIVFSAFSFWLNPLAKGDRMLAAGQYEDALEYFAKAESRITRFEIIRQLLPGTFQAVRTNQFHILYQLEDYDTLFQKTSSGPTQASSYFWAGAALFNRAMEETETESRVIWLERAVAEFRGAFEIDRDNWDIKYNFELAERILAELREETETPPTELPELLRQQQQQDDPPFVPLG